MKNILFVICGLFFFAALYFQFRHNFYDEDFRRAKISEFRFNNMFANMPAGGYSANEAQNNIARNIERLNAQRSKDRDYGRHAV